MIKRFVVNCDICNKVRKIKRDKRTNFPEFNMPFNWHEVNNKTVCSFKCAAKVYGEMCHKNIFDIFREKFSQTMSLIGI